MAENWRRERAESLLRGRFATWLDDLTDNQVRELLENWDNVMNDAALTRVESWEIATATIAELRSQQPGQAVDRTPPSG